MILSASWIQDIVYHCQIGQTSAKYSAATWRTQWENWRSASGGLRSPSARLICCATIATWALVYYSVSIRRVVGMLAVSRVTTNHATVFEVKRSRSQGSITMTHKMLKKWSRYKLPESRGPYRSADLRFLSPQPDTSLHCKAIGQCVFLWCSFC